MSLLPQAEQMHIALDQCGTASALLRRSTQPRYRIEGSRYPTTDSKCPWPPGIGDQGPMRGHILGTEGCPLVREVGYLAAVAITKIKMCGGSLLRVD